MSDYSSSQHFGHSLPKVSLVMQVVFYLPCDHREVAPHLNRLLDVYLQFLGSEASRLTTGWDPDIDERSLRLTPENWEQVRRNLENARHAYLDDLEKDSLEFFVRYKRGFDRWGILTSDASGPHGYEFNFRARLTWREPTSEFSILTVSVPIGFLESHDPGMARDLALALAEPLPFVTGHAGLSLSFTRGQNRLLPILKDQLTRHPGWDVPNMARALYLGKQIDGVHWLNFLGPSVLHAVGGAQSLRSGLMHPDTTVQEFAGGRAVISLGPAPLAGDTKRLDEPEPLHAYRELAQVLEPWLLPFNPRTTWEGFTEEEARRWWRRFLD